MTEGDFYGSEQSHIMNSAGSLKVVFKPGHFMFNTTVKSTHTNKNSTTVLYKGTHESMSTNEASYMSVVNTT